MDTANVTPIQMTREKSSKEKLKLLEALNWQKVQLAGALFADALHDDRLTPTADQLADLIQLTARLLEFVANAKEIVFDDPNSLLNAC